MRCQATHVRSRPSTRHSRAQLHRLRAAADRGDAGARHIDEAQRAHQVDEGSILTGAPVISNTKLVCVVSTTRARKISRDAHRFDPLARRCRQPSPAPFRARCPALAVVQLVTRCTGTRRRSCASICSITSRRAGGDDGDARGVRGVIDFGHRQAFDVVAATGEQPDDARQHARLIVDENRDGVALDPARVFAASAITPASFLRR